jgi:hypothetical protein
MMEPIRSKGKSSIFICIVIMLLGYACAGTAPTAKMAKLESAITTARQAEAITYAPLELKFAEDKYKKTQAAVEEKEYEEANRLIDEALLDAHLAETRSLTAKAEKQAQEMRESIETLRSEVKRSQK